MSFRFVTKSIHAYLIDYPFAIVESRTTTARIQ